MASRLIIVSISKQVLQVNVFVLAVLKSEDEFSYTELKAIVMCTGACFSFYKMACHVHLYKQITVCKCTLFFLANVILFFMGQCT